MLTGRQLGEVAYEAWGRYGVPVFPCNNDKKPICKWGTEASTDKDAIIALFESRGERATMIGASMGEVANLFVLDFDFYKGNEAKKFFDVLQLAGLLPPTLVHETRSGGIHYYYMVEDLKKMPRNSVSHEAVEIRGQGGFVIVPPTPGYKVQQDNPVEFAPEGLLRRLARADAAFKSLSTTDLKKQIIEGVSFHEALTALAAKLHASGMPPAEVQKQLSEAMEASVAANPHHERHSRWAKIMKGSDGELGRLSASAYDKFNPLKTTEMVEQAKPKMVAATRNRDVTLGGFFMKAPDELNPKKGAFGNPEKKAAQQAESAKAPDDFPFARSYRGDKVEEQDNKNFLIYPLVMESDVVVLSAAPKAGKTLTTMNLCLHAAAGLPIGDQLIPMNKEGKTAPVSVIYFALEGQGAIRKRVKAWIKDQEKQGRKFTEDQLQIYVVEQALNLADDTSKQDTVDKLVLAQAFFQRKGWGQIGMVVFDTLTKAMPGKDQNSVEDTSSVFATVDMMREVGLSCAVFFIHHNSKNNGAPRGSGNIMAEPDTVLMVNKGEQIVEDGDYKDTYKLHVHMARAIDDGQEYTFAATSVDIGTNSQGIMENAPVLRPLENYKAAPTATETKLKNVALGAQSAFYETLWQTLSDADNMTLTYGAIHKLLTKGQPAVASFYSQHLNANSKEAVKAALTALLSKQRLPASLTGITFELGDNSVKMVLGQKQTGTA